ncbi:MAG: glycosyltransferase family 4 protein [bacterium]
MPAIPHIFYHYYRCQSKKPMKVLQAVPHLEYGGVERGVVEITRALIESGARAYVVSAGGRLVSEIEKMGGIHFTLPVGSKNPITALSCIRPLRKFLQQEGISLIDAHSRVPAWVSYFAVKGTSTHFLTTAHGYYRPHFFSRSMVLGEKIIAVSQPLAQYLREKFCVPEDKIVVIPRGIQLEDFPVPPQEETVKFREKYRVPADAFVAGMLARITPTKGHQVFLKALHQLRKRNVPVYALIGGNALEHPGYAKSLKNLVKNLMLENFVRFAGFTENVSLFLSAVDVVVIPSLTPEAFGRGAMEAMALKKPVVASSHGGILDIVLNGKTGFLFSPGNVSELADALFWLYSNPQKRLQMGENGFVHIQKHFTLSLFTQRTLQVYRSLVEASGTQE